MSRIPASVIAAAGIFAVAACGNGNTTNGNSPDGNTVGGGGGGDGDGDSAPEKIIITAMAKIVFFIAF